MTEVVKPEMGRNSWNVVRRELYREQGGLMRLLGATRCNSVDGIFRGWDWRFPVQALRGHPLFQVLRHQFQSLLWLASEVRPLRLRPDS